MIDLQKLKQEHAMFCIGGNQIGAKTQDLNVDFRSIVEQLDRIAKEYFEKG